MALINLEAMLAYERGAEGSASQRDVVFLHNFASRSGLESIWSH